MNEWKTRVIDALVTSWAYKAEHENNPQLALADLIAAEIHFALSPEISSDAQALIDRGYRAALEAAAEWATNRLRESSFVNAQWAGEQIRALAREDQRDGGGSVEAHPPWTGANKPAAAPPAWHELYERADAIVRSKPTWQRFIDGTPLANDIPVWMAAFAQEQAKLNAAFAAKGE